MAQVFEPRVRETSVTTGTADYTLAGRFTGSMAFAEALAVADVCDYVAQYLDAFEEGIGTLGVDGKLQRTTIIRSRHSDGTIDTSKVSWPAGVKTIVMHFHSARVRDLVALAAKAVRTDVAQTFTAPEKRQALDNLGLFPTGTVMLFGQTAAPAGWTKSTTHNDKSLRIVSGTVGSGGSVDFSACFSRTATDSFTLSQSNLPAATLTVSIGSGQGSHAHSLSALSETGTGSWHATAPLDSGRITTTNTSTLPALSGTAPLGGSGTSFQIGMDMRVKYCDAIFAVKD